MNAIKVVIIDENLFEVEAMVQELQRASYDPQWERIESRQELIAALKSPPDLILAHYSPLKFDALKALEYMRTAKVHCPLIVMSGIAGEDLAVECMKRGAADFLLKKRLGQLPAAVKSLLESRTSPAETSSPATNVIAFDDSFRFIFDNQAEIISRCRVDGTILFVNEQFCNLFRRTKSELIGYNIFQLLPPALQDAARARFASVAESQGVVTYEQEVHLPDGRRAWLQWMERAAINQQTKVAEVISSAREITQLKRTEEALRRQGKMLHSVLHTIPDGVMVADRVGKLLHWNPAAEMVFGKALADVPLQDWPQRFGIFSDETGTLATADDLPLASTLRGETVERKELFVRNQFAPDGMWLSFAGRPLQNQEGALRGGVVVFRNVSDARRTVRVAEEQRDFLRSVIDQTPALLFARDSAGRYTMANRRTAELLGTTVEKIEGKTAGEVGITESGVLQMRDDTDIAQENGKSFRTVQTPFPVAGQPGILGAAMELPQSLLPSAAPESPLREPDAPFHIFVDNCTDPVWIKDDEFRFRRLNAPFARFVSISDPEAAVGKTGLDVLPLVFASRLVELENRVFETGTPLIDAMESFPSGGKEERFSISIFPLEENGGHISGILGLARNMTGVVEARGAADRIQSLTRRLFDDVKDGMVVTDPQGGILNANQAALDMMGYESVAKVKEVGRLSTLLVHPQAQGRILQEIEQRGFIRDTEVDIHSRDERIIRALVTAWAGYSSSGQIEQIQLVVRDVTAQREREQLLSKKQKMDSLAAVAGGIAHDFNNILSIILGQSYLLEKWKNAPDKLAEIIQSIVRTVDRGSATIKQIMTFARKAEAEMRPVIVNQSVEELTRMLTETFPRTISILFVPANNLPVLVADASQFNQALLNICMNARDAMPDGGLLTISTQLAEAQSIRTRFPEAHAKHYIIIEVTDTGHGMGETTLQRIFEPFFTTKGTGKGAGLGLAFVHGVMDTHKGFVDVDSDPGRGTTIRLYFPAVVQDVERVDRKHMDTEMSPGGTETVLVVEDEEMVLTVLKGILEEKGYRVLTATDGEQAVKVYAENRHDVSLVLTDIGLPKYNGDTVFERLKEINPDVKVIFASGYVDYHTKSEFFKAGAKDFIQKPYLPKRVLHSIRVVLDM